MRYKWLGVEKEGHYYLTLFMSVISTYVNTYYEIYILGKRRQYYLRMRRFKSIGRKREKVVL
jgi:hypothetical protein